MGEEGEKEGEGEREGGRRGDRGGGGEQGGTNERESPTETPTHPLVPSFCIICKAFSMCLRSLQHTLGVAASLACSPTACRKSNDQVICKGADNAR